MPGCPASAEIEDYLRGRLSVERRASVEAHLEGCVRCHDAVVDGEIALLLPADVASTPPAVGADPASRPESGGQFGRYRIIEELGRGGQARVYLVEDTRLPRRVALKVFQSGLSASDNVLERFRREAAALSRLDHPGICTVHETGEWNGSPYIAMRHVEGGSLAQRLRPTGAAGAAAHAASQEEILALVEQAARALHAAHQAGLVHRDIKPSNILISKDGEPVIVDFGLARDHEHKDQSLTRTGDLAGTPAYMSPEQVRGDRDAVDRQSDVFALGVTLFEALTGELPFDAPTTAGVFQRILAGDWTSPANAGRPLAKDLCVILATALEQDRRRRYQTALAFAEDLRRFRQRQTILARPATTTLRLRRWVERNPGTAASLAAVFLTLATALAVSLALLGRVRQESEGRAEALRREEGMRLALQSSALRATNPGLALLLAEEAADRSPSLAASNALLGALQASHERSRLFGHSGWVRRVAFSPDGRRVVTASDDRTARVWDVASGRTLSTAQGHTGEVWTAEFDAGGTRILTAAEDATARIWDAASGKELVRFTGHQHGVKSAAYSPDGSEVLTVGRDTARLWNAATGELRHLLEGHRGAIQCAIFDGAGKRIATGSADGTAIIWDATKGRSHAVLREHHAAVYCARFSGNGARLITGAHDGSVRVWDESGRAVAALVGHTLPVRAVAIAPDGYWAATASDDFTARIWHVESGKELLALRHDGRIVSLDVLPEAGILVTASYDATARVWGLTTGKLLQVFAGHAGIITGAVFSPAGDLVATASVDHTARIWSFEPPSPRDATAWTGENVESACLDPGGELVAVVPASAPSEARIGPARASVSGSASPRIRLEGHTEAITQIAFSPDGRRVLTASRDATARLWRAEDGTLLHELAGHTAPILSARFSAGGARLATASEDRTARVWSVEDGKEICQIAARSKPCHIASLSPDGSHLVCGAQDGSLVLADAATGAVIRPLEDAHEHLMSAEWSPDGSRTVAANSTNRVHVRDPFTGRSLGVLEHPSRSYTAIYSLDGRWIVTTCHDRIVRVWDARSHQEALHVSVPGFAGQDISFDAGGRWLAVYGYDIATVQGGMRGQRGRLLVSPLDPRAEARRWRPGEITPGEREQYQIGSADDRARRRAGWKGGEIYGGAE